MTKILIAVVATALFVLPYISLGQEKETKAMEKHNRNFMERERQRPASEKDFRQTKEYEKASPKERAAGEKAYNAIKETLDKERQKGDQLD